MNQAAPAAFKFDRFTLLLATLALLATGLTLLRQVNYGPNLIGDSLLYISTARNLAAGNGFVDLWALDYVDAPPLFPLAIALGSFLGLEAVAAAGIINAVAFGLTVLLATMWLRRRVQSPFLVLWAGAALVLAYRLSFLANSVMNEPLFILWVTLTLLALDRYFEGRERSFLLLAATAAGLALATRYVGYTILLAAPPLFLLFRGATTGRRIKDLALFYAIALVPIGLWALWMLLTADRSPTFHPVEFSWLSSLDTAVSELLRWVFGNTGYYRLEGALSRLGIADLGGELTVAGLLWKSAFLAGFLAIAGGVAVRARRLSPQPAPGWEVPLTFALVYSLALAVHLPLSNVDLPARYLTPLFPPLLVVAAVVVLDPYLRYSWADLPLLRRWKRETKERNALNLPALVLMIGLVLWLLPQSYISYVNTKTFLTEGYGYASREWREMELIRYLQADLPEGYIFTDMPVEGLYFNTELRVTETRFILDLQVSLNQTRHRIVNLLAEGEEVTAILVDAPYQDRRIKIGYTAQELLAAAPGLKLVVDSEEGAILRGDGELARSAMAQGPSPAVLAKFPQARLMARSRFAVYYEDQSNRLIYVKEQCRPEEAKPEFLLHLYPVDQADLPAERRGVGFVSLKFNLEHHRLPDTELCMAVRYLPDYAVAEIGTGQYLRDGDKYWNLWKVKFPLDGE